MKRMGSSCCLVTQGCPGSCTTVVFQASKPFCELPDTRSITSLLCLTQLESWGFFLPKKKKSKLFWQKIWGGQKQKTNSNILKKTGPSMTFTFTLHILTMTSYRQNCKTEVLVTIHILISTTTNGSLQLSINSKY